MTTFTPLRSQAIGRFELEHVPCDLCGSNIYRTRYTKPDSWLRNCAFQFPVVECTECGLVFLNPRPTPESMREFYPSDYHENRDDEASRARYERQTRFLSIAEGDRILDVGCAKGDFLSFLADEISKKLQLVGVDSYSQGVTNPNIEFHRCQLPDAKLASASFDTVTSWAVFEHLHTPMAYFQSVKRLLRKGGQFVFLVTNSESLYGTRAYTEDVPRHTYHFSEQTLLKYASKCNFSDCRFEFCDDIYDGRGFGTAFYALKALAGWTWEREITTGSSRLQRLMGRLGAKIDRVAFRSHWETQRRRSGIVVATFTA